MSLHSARSAALRAELERTRYVLQDVWAGEWFDAAEAVRLQNKIHHLLRLIREEESRNAL